MLPSACHTADSYILLIARIPDGSINSSVNYKQTEVVMAECGESDLEDLNVDEWTDIPNVDNSDNDVEGNTRGYHIHKRLLTTNRIVNSIDACFEVDHFNEIHVPLGLKADAK